MQRTVRYDVALIQEDMASLGLQSIDVARRCRPSAAASSVTRFLHGTHQTARMAKRIARALRHPLERYTLRASEAA